MEDVIHSNTPSGHSETHTCTHFFFVDVSVFCFSERKMAESSKKAATRPKPLSILRSMEEKYTAAMKKLQFGELNYTSLLVIDTSFYWLIRQL